MSKRKYESPHLGPIEGYKKINIYQLPPPQPRPTEVHRPLPSVPLPRPVQRPRSPSPIRVPSIPAQVPSLSRVPSITSQPPIVGYQKINIYQTSIPPSIPPSKPASPIRISPPKPGPAVLVFDVYIDPQNNLNCGVHALNNVFMNWSRRLDVFGVHKGTYPYFVSSRRGYTPTNYTAINLPELCRQNQAEQIARAGTAADKKRAAIDYACNPAGDYPVEVISKALNTINWIKPVPVFDEDRVGDQGFVPNRYKVGDRWVDYTGDQFRGNMYDEMLRRCSRNVNILGYVIANDYTRRSKFKSTHYVAIIPKRFDHDGEVVGLIFLDSLNDARYNPNGQEYPLVDESISKFNVYAPLITKEQFKYQAEYFFQIIEVECLPTRL
jgi:hypothetical protein